MKTITLLSIITLLSVTTKSQWNLGLQTGLNKTFYKDTKDRLGKSQIGDTKSTPALLTSAYIISKKEWPVNVGAGLGIKRNHIDIYYERKYSSGAKDVRDIEHRSTFVTISPIVDVGIGKRKFIHLLVMPSINLLLYGRENGNIQYSTGEYYSYQNTSKYIRRLSLGINAQLQGRYPLTSMLDITGGIGYSVNNGISKVVWSESGNASFQFGVIYKLPSLTGNKKDDKPEAN